MPKVTDEYLNDKKNYILKCIEEVLKEKPLYSVTMRDIIKKAGFSQGIIYHYYSGLDEIYVDYLNKNISYSPPEAKIDAILNSDQTEKEKLAACIIALGNLTSDIMDFLIGKKYFEMMILYALDYEKRVMLSTQLKSKQSLEYIINKTIEFVKINIENGVFQPQIPIESIVMFVGNFVDGVAFNLAVYTEESNTLTVDIPGMFQALAKSVIGFLEAEAK